MVKVLSFKGDKKLKKRKRENHENDGCEDALASKAQTNPSGTVESQDFDTEDLMWVSAELPNDISGPILLVLATDPPSALATDANGKIFASTIENVVPGNPDLVEPHDVRQVWIGNRVAGTGHCTFKSNHGKYLSCDKFGVLSATKDAISIEELWTIILMPDMKAEFALQTHRQGFVSVHQDDEEKSIETGVKIRGDSKDLGLKTSVRVRMQARFKPRLKMAKEGKAREKISRKELELAVGRKLEDDEVKLLKRAKRAGVYHEALLDVKVKGKHDKFA